MPAVIFNGTKVKSLKSTLSLFGGADVISSTVNPTSVAVSANAGSLLLNTSSGNLYKKNDNGSTTNWSLLAVGSGAGTVTVATKTANYTATSADDVLIFNATSDVTLTMHSVATATSKPYRVKNIGSSSLTIAPNGADTFDGDSSIILSPGGVPQQAVELIPNGGTAWYIF